MVLTAYMLKRPYLLPSITHSYVTQRKSNLSSRFGSYTLALGSVVGKGLDELWPSCGHLACVLIQNFEREYTYNFRFFKLGQKGGDPYEADEKPHGANASKQYL